MNTFAQSFQNMLRSKNAWIILLGVILTIWIWYITIPALLIWLVYKKSNFSKTGKIVSTVLIVIVALFALLASLGMKHVPTIAIIQPQSGITIESREVTVRGEVIPLNAEVKFNDQVIPVVEGKFSYVAPLPLERNKLVFTARNGTYESEATVLVNRKLSQEEIAEQQKIKAEEEARKQAEAEALKRQEEERQQAEAEALRRQEEEQVAQKKAEEEANKPKQLNIVVTNQIVKKVGSKYRYFFDIRNKDTVNFEGVVTIELFKKDGTRLGMEDFKTNRPIEPNLGWSGYIEINTGPYYSSYGEEQGIAGYRYTAKVNGQTVKTDQFIITNEFEGL